jgi:dynein heavy chain
MCVCGLVDVGHTAPAVSQVTGLAGERDRWEASITQFEMEISMLPGDVVVASAFMAYAGPFPSEYREELIKETWLPQVRRPPTPVTVASSCLSYLFVVACSIALFSRHLLLHSASQVRNLNIPASEAFDFALFLANPSDVRDWNIQVSPCTNSVTIRQVDMACCACVLHNTYILYTYAYQ